MAGKPMTRRARKGASSIGPIGPIDRCLIPRDFCSKQTYLVRILKITGGNVTKAARLAGRNRTEFYRLLERHSLEPGMFKGNPQKERITA